MINWSQYTTLCTNTARTYISGIEPIKSLHVALNLVYAANIPPKKQSITLCLLQQ